MFKEGSPVIHAASFRPDQLQAVDFSDICRVSSMLNIARSIFPEGATKEIGPHQQYPVPWRQIGILKIDEHSVPAFPHPIYVLGEAWAVDHHEIIPEAVNDHNLVVVAQKKPGRRAAVQIVFPKPGENGSHSPAQLHVFHWNTPDLKTGEGVEAHLVGYATRQHEALYHDSWKHSAPRILVVTASCYFTDHTTQKEYDGIVIVD